MYLSRCAFGICVAAILAACAGSAPSFNGVPGSQPVSKIDRPVAPPRIQNLIVVIQQDRSFDNLFAGFPGADAPHKGLTSKGKYVPLVPIRLQTNACQIYLGYGQYFDIAWDHGKMDGWNLLDHKRPLCPYTRVADHDKRLYWQLARQYALADHMFSSTRFDNFVEQLYLISGTTQIGAQKYVAGPPNGAVWGCNAPPGSHTTLLDRGRIQRGAGPFPCFTQVRTMANLFDDAGISWRYYFDPPGSGGTDWNPFEAIKYVFEGSDWINDMSAPVTNVLPDIASGTLPSVSWVLSAPRDSDAPGASGGPKWVTAIVNALKNSKYWPHAAIVIVWAEAGDGDFYDNVAPPQLDPMGLGFRVPLITVSPLAKHGYISHTQYEFGSILKFIEENWGLPRLGGHATDARANSIGDMFQ
ncbi:MAG TPA: alkaline phosphatase family protein [Candidatus Cybelea sp.]|jgi:phospholipase C|nr:alkaline phosphatase family protein [Candidatus Cybelea sp.]